MQRMPRTKGDDMDQIMTGVQEYREEMDVCLSQEHGRPVIIATNEAGFNSTSVDLLQLLEWLRANKPELLS